MILRYMNVRYPVIISLLVAFSLWVYFMICPCYATNILTFKVPTGTIMLQVKYIHGKGNNIGDIIVWAPKVGHELSATYLRNNIATQGPENIYKPSTWGCTPACKWAIHHIIPQVMAYKRLTGTSTWSIL